MTCADMAERAAGLAALGEDDPERRAAEAHAAGCAACTSALAEGVALQTLLEVAMPVAAPHPEALARARREILAELAGEAKPGDARPGEAKPGDARPGDARPGDARPGEARPGDARPGDARPGEARPGDARPGEAQEPAGRAATVSPPRSARRPPWRGAAVVGAAVLAAWLLPLAASRRVGAALGSAGAVGLAAVAAAAAAAAITFGRGLVAALPFAAIGAALLSGEAGPLSPQKGVHCLLFELGVAVPALAVAAGLVLRRVAPGAWHTGAAAAAGGALAGQAALVVSCKAAATHAHLLAFHAGGVVLAGALGAVAFVVLGRLRAPIAP